MPARDVGRRVRQARRWDTGCASKIAAVHAAVGVAKMPRGAAVVDERIARPTGHRRSGCLRVDNRQRIRPAASGLTPCSALRRRPSTKRGSAGSSSSFAAGSFAGMRHAERTSAVQDRTAKDASNVERAAPSEAILEIQLELSRALAVESRQIVRRVELVSAVFHCVTAIVEQVESSRPRTRLRGDRKFLVQLSACGARLVAPASLPDRVGGAWRFAAPQYWSSADSGCVVPFASVISAGPNTDRRY